MIDPLTRKVQPLSHGKERKPLSREIQSMYKILTVTVCVLSVSATLSYLYINSLKPAKGYTLKQLQIDYENLESENRDLEKKIIDARSYIQLENGRDLDGMENADNGDFSYVDESKVAKNNNGEARY